MKRILPHIILPLFLSAQLALAQNADWHAAFPGFKIAGNLYYVGSKGQANYLIPVDVRLATDFDVEDETVPLDRVLQALAPARRLRLVLLDACRENPLLKSMQRTAATRSVGRGLGRVEPATANTLIAFATNPISVGATLAAQN